METIAAVGGMLMINLVGWAFAIGILWQKVGGLEGRQGRHENLGLSRAHPRDNSPGK